MSGQDHEGLVERVAKAMWAKDNPYGAQGGRLQSDFGGGYTLEQDLDLDWQLNGESFRKLARAALECPALSALLQENARMKEALKPFAAEADMWAEMGDARPIYSLPAMDSGGPTVGDLRRARAALSPSDGGEGA